jgi:hypothetical protein
LHTSFTILALDIGNDAAAADLEIYMYPAA